MCVLGEAMLTLVSIERETLTHRIKLPEVALGISIARLNSQPLSWLRHA